MKLTKLENEMSIIEQHAAAVNELQRPECNRPNAELYRAMAYGKSTEKEVQQLRRQIEGLPDVATYRPIRVLLRVLVEHTVHDYVEPPLHNFPSEFETRTPNAELAMALQDVGVSRQDIMKVATHIAIEQHPEIFEHGYTDRGAHDAKLATAQQALSDALSHASSCWDMSDISFHSGVCTFRLSQGMVTVGDGPGDTRAIEQLLAWMKQPKPAEPEQDEGAVIEFTPGQARRV